MKSMFPDDLQTFIYWLDKQIEPTLAGEDTPLNYVVNTILVNQTIFSTIEDAVCYFIIESFLANEDFICFDVLRLKYDRELSDKEKCDLLLEIPIKYVMLLLK